MLEYECRKLFCIDECEYQFSEYSERKYNLRVETAGWKSTKKKKEKMEKKGLVKPGLIPHKRGACIFSSYGSH